MGYREINLSLPTDYTEETLRDRIRRQLGIADFSHQVQRKSLDARKKSDIHWRLQVGVFSEELAGEPPPVAPDLVIAHRKKSGRAVVVGSGPAGFFSALVLQTAGFDVVLLERGCDVSRRAEDIRSFEQTGAFSPSGNYAFGEGGAGTFSDGKLTSRTKSISAEKAFILESYLHAGAPEEIAYMAHPHLGSDRLPGIVANLRKRFMEMGGRLLFETRAADLTIRGGRVVEVLTDTGGFAADEVIFAPGHSAYETYRMLIGRGVLFQTKGFAVGSRVEHPQEIINTAQWGRPRLPGVKAAEYRLTSNRPGNLPVYTFCMCPGGVIVPSGAYPGLNIVNGMSRYRRSGPFANAACVAGVHIDRLTGRETSPLEALNWLESLERRFFDFAGGYRAPFCTVHDFIHEKQGSAVPATSYPLGLTPAALWELLPPPVSRSIAAALVDFKNKIRGFDTGILMGLESKTSAPLQVLREKNRTCAGFENLYVAGEGSGHAGGIISSGADGIKAAMAVIAKRDGKL